MSEDYDIAIIGGGNAGFAVSAIAHKAGLRLAMIEDADFGGTCPNRGCTPKKVLVAAGEALETIAKAGRHGIDVGPAKLDWSKLIDREKDMIGFIPDAMAGVAAKRADVIRGRARFTGPNNLTIGDRSISAKSIVVATGSRPRPLTIPGADLMITSDEILSHREQPASVTFVGGGVIALEFAHVYARAGTKVTILEAMDSLLPRMEAGAVAALAEATSALGVDIKTAVTVEKVTRRADGLLEVVYVVDGVENHVVSDSVVNGTGRIANIDGLDLDAGQVTLENGRVLLDETLRSVSNPSVYFAGDVLTTSPQLSPVATYEGQIVGENIVHDAKRVPDYGVIPQAIYTSPSLASVGLTEAAARAAGHAFQVKENDLAGWFSSKAYLEDHVYAKVLIEEGSTKILGAHMVGHHAADLVHLFAFAMKFGISADQMKDTIYAFPSFSSDVKNLI